MYDEVLVPTDGSDAIPETLDHALSIAGFTDATVHALYVVDDRIPRAADAAADDVRGALEAEGERAVAAVVDRADAAGLETASELRAGRPSREILAYAEERDLDLIVIGTVGKSPREKVRSLGSVSERVVDGASTPVLVVRNVGEGA